MFAAYMGTFWYYCTENFKIPETSLVSLMDIDEDTRLASEQHKVSYSPVTTALFQVI